MLCLIDCSLRDRTGHYYHYLKTLYDHAKGMGLPVRVLGHRSVTREILESFPVEPVFRHDFHHLYCHPSLIRFPRASGWYDVVRANREFWRDLKRALQNRVSPDDLVFCSMSDHRQLLAWSWFLSGYEPGASPAVVLMFRLDCPDDADAPARSPAPVAARWGFRVLERAARGHRVRIATDSERLAQAYSRVTSLPVEVFPIPHTVALSRATLLEEGRGEVRFVSLGDAREEKGFPLLVEAIRILRDRGEMHGMRFVLQCHISSHHHAPMRAYVSMLEHMGLSNVQRITAPLDTEAYHRLILDAHVVVLPYRRRTYRARTSGPLVEAFAAGKPIIATEGTWLSDQLRRYGSGAVFRDGDAADLADAMLAVRDRYGELAEASRNLRAAWLERHNPRAFFQKLIGTG